MEGHVDPVIPDPILGGFGNTRVSGGHSLVTAVDICVGESGAGDANGGATTGCPEGVVGSPTPDAEGGTLGSKVPTNSGEEFDRSSKTKKTHGSRS
jgi:hypothetical protein